MFQSIRKQSKRFMGLIAAALMLATMSVTALASAPATGVTTDMLEPVVDGIIANIGVVLPVGLGIFGILVGVFLIFRILRRTTTG